MIEDVIVSRDDKELKSLPGISQHLSSKSTTILSSRVEKLKQAACRYLVSFPRCLDQTELPGYWIQAPAFFLFLCLKVLLPSCILCLDMLLFITVNYRSSGDTAHVVMDPVLLELL